VSKFFEDASQEMGGTAGSRKHDEEEPAAADQTGILDVRYQGRRAELLIGHVSQDDEVTEIREPVWQRGALDDETAGRVSANHNQERRQTLAMMVSVSTTRVLQIGESTLLPNGCNNIVRFVPRLLGCFGCLLASCFVVATHLT